VRGKKKAGIYIKMSWKIENKFSVSPYDRKVEEDMRASGKSDENFSNGFSPFRA
jgi:hypothetical protein